MNTNKKERRELLHFANVGILVATVILFGGAFLFKDAGEGALQAVSLVGFFSGFAVLHGLDERAKRRRKRGQ
jgi:hypothetical protein